MNPLLQKYNELYNPKPPEPPKPVEKPKSPILKSFDRDDLKVSFQQVADKIEQGKAQVASMSMDRNIMSGAKITFEVYVDD